MSISSMFRLALKNIMANKMRSFLTMLGIVIGISSVICLVGIGNGATSSISDSVQSMGTNILTVNINSSDASLTSEQVDKLSGLSNISAVAPYKTVSATVSRDGSSSSRASVVATTNGYFEANDYSLSSGRYLSSIDNVNASKVCIIGAQLAEDLFSLTSPVGETIKINGDNFTVIGVMEKAGSSMGNNVDSMLLIPLQSAKYLGSDTTITSLYVKVEDETIVDATITQIEMWLRSTLQISSDYYSVTSQSSMLEALSTINNTLSLLLGGIASISLIVGGIGVMNVMLVSVSERTKEIGIRKSLGARKRDILVQFLVEALLLCILGGTIGIVFGLFLGVVCQNFGLSFTVTTNVILIAFGSSAGIGLIFGSFPSYRAAGLKPIDALHAE